MIRILPALTRAKANIKNQYNDLSRSQSYAREIGVRTAKIKHHSEDVDKYVRASRVRQGTKILTPINLPVVGFVFGMILPLPLTSVMFSVVGAVVGAGWYMRNKLSSKSQNNKTS